MRALPRICAFQRSPGLPDTLWPRGCRDGTALRASCARPCSVELSPSLRRAGARAAPRGAAERKERHDGAVNASAARSRSRPTRRLASACSCATSARACSRSATTRWPCSACSWSAWLLFVVGQRRPAPDVEAAGLRAGCRRGSEARIDPDDGALRADAGRAERDRPRHRRRPARADPPAGRASPAGCRAATGSRRSRSAGWSRKPGRSASGPSSTRP